MYLPVEGDDEPVVPEAEAVVVPEAVAVPGTVRRQVLDSAAVWSEVLSEL